MIWGVGNRGASTMTHALFRTALPFGAAALLAWCAPAAAQQSAPAQAPATPAPAKPHPAPKPPAPRPAGAPKPATPAPATASAPQPNFLGQYGDWGAYSASPGGRKL